MTIGQSLARNEPLTSEFQINGASSYPATALRLFRTLQVILRMPESRHPPWCVNLAIILDVEATPARWQAAAAAANTMLQRTKECFGLQPQRLAADTAYGSGLMIGWLMRRGIEPHVPVLDRERQTKGYFSRADFKFDEHANRFICPGGKALTSSGLVRSDGAVPYCASTTDCRACSLKPNCTSGSKRNVTRHILKSNASMCAR